MTAPLVPRRVYACIHCGATAEAIGADVWDHPGLGKGQIRYVCALGPISGSPVWLPSGAEPHPCPDAGLTLRRDRVWEPPVYEPPGPEGAAVEAELAAWRASIARPMLWWDREDKGLLIGCLDLPKMTLIGGGEL